MGKNSFRILSLEACDIVRSSLENPEQGYVLPAEKNEKYYTLFSNVLDWSLDSVELQNIYAKKERKKFSFQDEKVFSYTLAVVNVDFDRCLRENVEETEEQKAKRVSQKKKKKGKDTEQEKKPKGKVLLDVFKLRRKLYEDGFCINGVEYVRYKRSAGSSRMGKCLFIQKSLLRSMEKWGECGLKWNPVKLATWEAYKALSLSSLKGVVRIPLEGILFVPDRYSSFEEEVVSVREEDGKIVAEQGKTIVTNTIWDGEALLDESVFQDGYADKHMMLLRNKFFKSCAFRTKIQKWFADNGITDLSVLTENGGVTLATDIHQIVMITTPSSLKYLKFCKDTKLSSENIQNWANNVTDTFGVVKTDKRTKFFNGRMVSTSYQLLNTVQIDQESIYSFLEGNFNLIKQMNEDPSVMCYYYSNLSNREKEEQESTDTVAWEDSLINRSQLIFSLIRHNEGFRKTRLYYNFRETAIRSMKEMMKKGHFLVDGTNATLFGNGPELLRSVIGTYSPENLTLQKGEVRCMRFQDGEKILCARSPHITMGNLYLVTNKTKDDVWEYFDLGNNIVCVNAVGENVQQRLNGCDYDSDTMLMTSDPTLVRNAEKNYDLFKVPVCAIDEKDGETLDLTQGGYL